MAASGTTSACAENTDCTAVTAWAGGNYLRVRGEYILGLGLHYGYQELPPRARRIHLSKFGSAVDSGTTSACAENTLQTLSTRESCGNYLRVRGEYLGWV